MFKNTDSNDDRKSDTLSVLGKAFGMLKNKL